MPRAVTERGGGGGSASHDKRKLGNGVVEEFVFEDITANYEGEALLEARNTRSMPARVVHLEQRGDKADNKLDAMNERLGKVEVAVANMEGQFKVIPRLVDAMEKATTAMRDREHMTFTAKIDVDKAQAMGAAEVHKAQAIGVVEVTKNKWKTIQTIASILLAIATAISTAIAAKGC